MAVSCSGDTRPNIETAKLLPSTQSLWGVYVSEISLSFDIREGNIDLCTSFMRPLDVIWSVSPYSRALSVRLNSKGFLSHLKI